MPEPKSATPRRRLVVKKDLEDEGGARKCTFKLSANTDVRLSLYAKRKRLDRSMVVEQALSSRFTGSNPVSGFRAASRGQRFRTGILLNQCDDWAIWRMLKWG